MEHSHYFNDKSTLEAESCKELLAFVAFNHKSPITVNRMYYENSENKALIITHFNFRGSDWLLQRDSLNDTWAIKKKPEQNQMNRFTNISKEDIISGKF